MTANPRIIMLRVRSRRPNCLSILCTFPWKLAIVRETERAPQLRTERKQAIHRLRRLHRLRKTQKSLWLLEALKSRNSRAVKGTELFTDACSLLPVIRVICVICGLTAFAWLGMRMLFYWLR